MFHLSPRLGTLTLSALVITLSVLIVLTAAPALAQPTHFSRRVSSTAGEVQGSERPTPTFDGSEVLVAVGESIQAAVDRNPAGTRLRLAAGIHRLQQVTPKDGNTFTGEVGAVLSGARVLDRTAFTRVDRHWVLRGQTDETTFHGQMLPGRSRHAAVNDLFLDDRLADHVESRADVDATGEWFYDYDADEIVMFDAPTAFSAVELGTTENAFNGTAADVVIEHLTVTRYAPAAQRGAIHGDDGRHWTIRYTAVTENHGVNIRVGPGFYVHNNLITLAGQLGIGGLDNAAGYQAQVIVADNEIAYNHTLGYDWGWEAGSTKFVDTTGMLFENNWVHHNDGPGPWFDIDNRDAVIRSNLVEHNTMVGIFYEISYGAKIYDNISRFNGGSAWGDLGAGIYVSSSSDVEIHHNALYGNRSEVLATQGDRGVGAEGLYEVRNLNVHDNDMALGSVAPGIRVEHGDPEYYYNNAGNSFEANTYRIDAAQPNFWGGAHVNLGGWQSMGQDLTARTLPVGTTPQLSAGSIPFSPEPYGAA